MTRIEELRRTATVIRQARDASLEFAANYRRQAEDRERQASDLTLQLEDIERRIARIEAGDQQ